MLFDPVEISLNRGDERDDRLLESVRRQERYPVNFADRLGNADQARIDLTANDGDDALVVGGSMLEHEPVLWRHSLSLKVAMLGAFFLANGHLR